MELLILPNQLFNYKIIKNTIDKIKLKIEKIIIWEHPHYFKLYNYNKLKLILHRASMKIYEQYLIKNVKCNIEYIEFHEKWKWKTKNEKVMFESVDKLKNSKWL